MNYTFTIKGDRVHPRLTTDPVEAAQWATNVAPCEIEITTEDEAKVTTTGMNISAGETVERIEQRIGVLIDHYERQRP